MDSTKDRSWNAMKKESAPNGIDINRKQRKIFGKVGPDSTNAKDGRKDDCQCRTDKHIEDQSKFMIFNMLEIH